jgi:hypothetical protein
MRTVSLLAGLALLLNMILGILNFALTLERVGLRNPALWMLAQFSWILAEGFMVAFFFMLYSRQKN